MYLIDTNVISEFRKGNNANQGVKKFLEKVASENSKIFISVITLGELRRGVELIRHRGDIKQAQMLEVWLELILNEHAGQILDFTAPEAEVWGRLRVPKHENALDKQIAATALTYDLTLITRNIKDFTGMKIKILNPFE